MILDELKKQTKRIIKNEIETINSKIENLEKELDESQGNNFKMIKNYNEILKKERNEEKWLDSSDDVFRTIVIIGNIENELDDLLSTMHLPHQNTSNLSIPTTAPALINFNPIKSLLKKVGSWLWQYLSQMMTLKSWSASGGANLNIPGLSGAVTLQLNFG